MASPQNRTFPQIIPTDHTEKQSVTAACGRRVGEGQQTYLP